MNDNVKPSPGIVWRYSGISWDVDGLSIAHGDTIHSGKGHKVLSFVHDGSLRAEDGRSVRVLVCQEREASTRGLGLMALRDHDINRNKDCAGHLCLPWVNADSVFTQDVRLIRVYGARMAFRNREIVHD